MIIPVRDTDRQPIPHIFEKVTTGVEEQRFATGESGKTYVCRLSDSIDPAFVLEDTGDPSSLLKRDFTMPFNYANGLGQLLVFCSYNMYSFLPLINADEVPPAYWTTFASTRLMWREITPNTVRLLNMNILTGGGAAEGNIYLCFRTIYTAKPGSITEKPIIGDQGDNIGMELLGAGDGIVFKSPNGSRFKMTMTDDGQLSVDEV